MAGMTWTPTYCQRSIIAAKGASDDGVPLGDLLCRQLVGIAGGSELLSVNFEGERVAEPLKAWVRHSYLISGYYQAIHAAATTAAILEARSYSPRIKYTPPRKGARRSEVASLANLRSGLDQDPAHAANVAARRNARELDLLSWL